MPKYYVITCFENGGGQIMYFDGTGWSDNRRDAVLFQNEVQASRKVKRLDEDQPLGRSLANVVRWVNL